MLKHGVTLHILYESIVLLIDQSIKRPIGDVLGLSIKRFSSKLCRQCYHMILNQVVMCLVSEMSLRA